MSSDDRHAQQSFLTNLFGESHPGLGIILIVLVLVAESFFNLIGTLSLFIISITLSDGFTSFVQIGIMLSSILGRIAQVVGLYGLWQLHSWGWYVTMVFLILFVVLNIVITGTSSGNQIWTLILHVSAAAYLYHSKDKFIETDTPIRTQ